MGTSVLPFVLDQVFRGEWQQKEDDEERRRAAQAASAQFQPGRGDGIVRKVDDRGPFPPPNYNPNTPARIESLSQPLSQPQNDFLPVARPPVPSIANAAPVVDVTQGGDGVLRPSPPQAPQIAPPSNQAPGPPQAKPVTLFDMAGPDARTQLGSTEPQTNFERITTPPRLEAAPSSPPMRVTSPPVDLDSIRQAVERARAEYAPYAQAGPAERRALDTLAAGPSQHHGSGGWKGALEHVKDGLKLAGEIMAKGGGLVQAGEGLIGGIANPQLAHNYGYKLKLQSALPQAVSEADLREKILQRQRTANQAAMEPLQAANLISEIGRRGEQTEQGDRRLDQQDTRIGLTGRQLDDLEKRFAATEKDKRINRALSVARIPGRVFDPQAKAELENETGARLPDDFNPMTHDIIKTDKGYEVVQFPKSGPGYNVSPPIAQPPTGQSGFGAFKTQSDLERGFAQDEQRFTAAQQKYKGLAALAKDLNDQAGKFGGPTADQAAKARAAELKALQELENIKGKIQGRYPPGYIEMGPGQGDWWYIKSHPEKLPKGGDYPMPGGQKTYKTGKISGVFTGPGTMFPNQ